MRSRRDQEEAALSYADNSFDVAVLELPYIFGTQPGRKPVWLFLVEMIRGMKGVTLYPKGGTTMVTVRQVGQAVAGAIERNRGGKSYPIGYYNMTWKELLKIIHRYMGTPNKKILTIPNWMYTLGVRRIAKDLKARGIESGLDMIRYTDMQSAELFIDKSLGSEPLGVQPDDMDAAIGDSVRLCVDIMDRSFQTLGMFRYAFSPHAEDETCLSLAHTSIRALLPSGKQPTAWVRRRISRLIRSIPLLVRIRSQCCEG